VREAQLAVRPVPDGAVRSNRDDALVARRELGVEVVDERAQGADLARPPGRLDDPAQEDGEADGRAVDGG